MKKLNITKEQYDESKYFNKKYGALKFVSESGKLYKTDKGVVIALEGNNKELQDESLADIGNAIKKTAGALYDKTKAGVKKAGRAVSNFFNGNFRKNDTVEVTGGEDNDGNPLNMQGRVVKAGSDNTITIEFGRQAAESTEKDEGEDAGEKTSEVLTDVLAGIIDTVKDVADKNGIELPGEGEKADKDDDEEDDKGDDEEKDDAEDDDEEDIDPDDLDDDDKDDLRDGEFEITEGAPEDGCEDGKCCGGKCRHVKKECGVKEECGGGKCECTGKPSFKESAARRRRSRLVREAIQRRAKARKVRESLERRARAKKIMESLRKRRAQRVLESLRQRRAAKKVMESLRRRRVAKKVMESLRRKRALRKMMESSRTKRTARKVR